MISFFLLYISHIKIHIQIIKIVCVDFKIITKILSADMHINLVLIL